MTSTVTLVALAASLFSQVAAHGFVGSVKVGGTTYEGFDEARWIDNKYQDSAVLITNYLLPMYDVNSGYVNLATPFLNYIDTFFLKSDIACGTGAQAPALAAPVNAGDSVEWGVRY